MSLWIELIFACWLWCNNFWLYQHRTLFLWVLKASLLQLYLSVVLVRPPTVPRMVLWNRVCQSFHCDVYPGVFLELDHQVSLNFGMVLETLIVLCVTELDFLEKLFFCQNWRNWPKKGFWLKMVKNGCGQSGPWTLKLYLQNNRWN